MQSLLAMIDNFLVGAVPVNEFEQRFADCYLDDTPSEALSDYQVDAFGAVHEEFSWTDPEPDEESRRYGWISRAEFVQWLRAWRAGYGHGEPAS